MLRHAGFATTNKPANIFHGKVSGPLLAAYIRLHSRKNAIIPDILAHDFPADTNVSSASCMKAIFDIETLCVDRTAVFYCAQPPDSKQHTHASNHKLCCVRHDYQRCAENIDVSRTNDGGSSHFTEALQTRFQSGGVIL